jgi:hypothetical protein
MILQLHQWDVHKHLHMGNPDLKPCGNGLLLWFQLDKFDAVIVRINTLQAEVSEEPQVNPTANH